MRHMTLIRDTATGRDIVEGVTSDEFERLAGDLMPPPLELNCARPLEAPELNRSAPPALVRRGLTLRVLRLWHGSVVEGPGRRSVLQVSGCSVRCPGCYAQDTWDSKVGVDVPVERIGELLLDPAGEPRDGVTVLGGEPMDQPVGLAALLSRLDERGIHTTVYTGYTFEQLRRRPEPEVRRALVLTKLLIDGPFIQRLADGAGEWRGSRNQRLIELPGLWV